MVGTLQLLVTLTLLIAACTARGPLDLRSPNGANGLRYYNFGGKTFVARPKKGGIARTWRADMYTVGIPPKSRTHYSNRPIWTNWFPEAYKSHRYMPNMQKLWLDLFVLPNKYSVQLLFCETFFKAANKRLFKIKINGRYYRDGRFTRFPWRASVIDIYRMAGGRDRPIVLTVHNIKAWNGVINIRIIPVKENAFISGAIISPAHTKATRGRPALWTIKGNANA